MGAWGSGLYANDTTSDVRDSYMDFLLEGIDNQTAYEKTLEEYRDLIGDQDEPLFWYALADTQWRVGRLTPDVKAKALEWIENNGGLELWLESESKGAGWGKTLKKLRVKLDTEQPKEKHFRKINIPFQNPWNLNDVYAYRVHKKCFRLEGEIDIAYEKYILMQKIGEGQSFESTDTVMRVQIFDRLFDEVPSVDDAIETIRNYRLLPFSNPLDQRRRYKLRLLGMPDPFFMNLPLCKYEPVQMSAKLQQANSKRTKYNGDMFYPEDELTYICTLEGPLNKQHERSDAGNNQFCSWWDLYDIGRWFIEWKDVKYDIIGDGTFEYPTREQQIRIKSGLSK